MPFPPGYQAESAAFWSRINAEESAAKKADQVNHPSHYTQGGIECVDAIEAQLSPEEFRGWLRGQIARYQWRLGLKDAILQDAQKSQWYMNRLVAFLEKQSAHT